MLQYKNLQPNTWYLLHCIINETRKIYLCYTKQLSLGLELCYINDDGAGGDRGIYKVTHPEYHTYTPLTNVYINMEVDSAQVQQKVVTNLTII